MTTISDIEATDLDYGPASRVSPRWAARFGVLGIVLAVTTAVAWIITVAVWLIAT